MGDVLFVVDGGHETGLGHFYESATLADEHPTGTAVDFLVPSESDVVVEKLAAAGHPVETVEPSALPVAVADHDPDVAVFNLPFVDAETVAAVRSRVDSRLVVYGDTETNVDPGASDHCDVIVSSNRILDGFGGRRRRERNGTLRLVGPKYQVLRPEFYEYAGAYETHGLSRVLLQFGGADPSNLTTYFADELLGSDGEYLVDAVVGASFTAHEELRAVAASADGDSLTVHEDVDNVPELMHRSDFVVTSPGLSSLEALFVGAPTLAIYQNREQAEAYRDAWFAQALEDVSNAAALVERTYQRFTERPPEHDIGTGKAEVLETLYDT